MTNVTLSNLGQANNAGDMRALIQILYKTTFIDQFWGESATAGKHWVEKVPSGQGFKFPAFAAPVAEYHTQGVFIDGQAVANNEVSIYTDNEIIVPEYVGQLDKSLSHLANVVGMKASKAAEQLTYVTDRDVLLTMVKAARTATGPATGLPGGATLNAATAGTDASVLEAKIFEAKDAIMKKRQGLKGLNVFVAPEEATLLLRGLRLVNKDYTSGGNGSLDKGTINMCAGLPLVVAINMPNVSLVDDAAINAAAIVGTTTGNLLAKYRANCSTTKAIVAGYESVVSVVLEEPTVDVEWIAQNRAWFINAVSAKGHGVYNPAQAVEIRTADPA